MQYGGFPSPDRINRNRLAAGTLYTLFIIVSLFSSQEIVLDFIHVLINFKTIFSARTFIRQVADASMIDANNATH